MLGTTPKSVSLDLLCPGAEGGSRNLESGAIPELIYMWTLLFWASACVSIYAPNKRAEFLLYNVWKLYSLNPLWRRPFMWQYCVYCGSTCPAPIPVIPRSEASLQNHCRPQILASGVAKNKCLPSLDPAYQLCCKLRSQELPTSTMASFLEEEERATRE